VCVSRQSLQVQTTRGKSKRSESAAPDWPIIMSDKTVTNGRRPGVYYGMQSKSVSLSVRVLRRRQELAATTGTARWRHRCVDVCKYCSNNNTVSEQAMGRWVIWVSGSNGSLFGWVTWVMGQCMLTHDPPLFHQPSKSQ